MTAFSGSPSSISTIGSGSQSPKCRSARLRRRRNMSKQIRPTTVVNHPCRSLTFDASLRSSRNQHSCTASSASLIEPRML